MSWLVKVALVMIMSLASFFAQALDFEPDGITITHGKYLHDKADISTNRVSVKWDWNTETQVSSGWKLGGYFDLGYSQWQSHLSGKEVFSEGGADKTWAIHFSPVFRFEPQSIKTLAPFFDIGIGVSYQSEEKLESKRRWPINMGRHMQFEIRTVAGMRFGKQRQFEAFYGWFHYSNADTRIDNEGLDFQMFSLGWNW